MPAYNSVFAAINVDGEPLNEYQVQMNDAKKEISCWIPSQVGKEFTISYRNSSPDKHMGLFVETDGSTGSGWHLTPGRLGTIGGCQTSSTTERPFVFSAGQLVDDDDIQGGIPDLHNLGTITLLFREGRITRAAAKPAYHHTIPEQRQIPERGKKGVQTCVALGATRATGLRTHVDMKYSGNLIRIVFRYRPLEYLQAQGIAPLPPPPPPEPQPASPDPQRAPTTNKVKRKRVEVVEPQPRPSKARRTRAESRKLADIEISDDEDIEKLLALRTRIDTVLSKKNVAVKKEMKTEPRAVFLKGEVVDLT